MIHRLTRTLDIASAALDVVVVFLIDSFANNVNRRTQKPIELTIV